VEPFIRFAHQVLHSSNRVPTPMFTIRVYADDVVLLLRHVEECEYLPDILKTYCEASNEQINYQKSNLLPVGKWPQQQTINNIPIKAKTNILGLTVCTSFDDMVESNWSKVTASSRASMFKNVTRNLNLFQKILHVNNLHLADIPTTWKISAYEYINEIIPTEEKKYRHNITASPACKKCGYLDTQKHRVTNCGPAKLVWEEAKRRLYSIGDIQSVNGTNQVLLCIDPPTESNVFVHMWLAVSLLHYQLTTELPTVNDYIGMLKTEKIKVKYKYQSDARTKIHKLDLLQL
ncbi:hypothetical protein ANN_03247, partial [Periplaneta americana]